MIERLHHAQITIPKGEEDKARKFYCDLLGLKEIPKPEALAGRGGFWLELGYVQIHVGVEDDIERHKTKAHLAYLVRDLEYWRRKLLGKAIVVKEGIKIPGYERFEFRDPFGNRIEFLKESI